MAEFATFKDIPGMAPGVITGDTAWNLLRFAKAKGFALPAFSCASSSECNAVLEAGAKVGRPVVLQFSEESSAAFSGAALAHPVLGACTGAHYVRNVSPAYGVPVLLQSDLCARREWLDGMLEADEVFFENYGEPLFSCHGLGKEHLEGSGESYLKKMAKLKILLEAEVPVEEAGKTWQRLAKISERFTLALAFGGDGALRPEALEALQAQLVRGPGTERPGLFAFRGAAGEKEVRKALCHGLVKASSDAEAAWAYWEGALKYYKANSGYLQGQLGNPEGADAPNKGRYGSETWLREAEVSLRDRVVAACGGLGNDGIPRELAGYTGNLPLDVLVELRETASKLCAPGKGFLAADESAGPWLRAGHAQAAKIPDTEENRAAYRSLCFTTPGLSEHVSGVILHWETLFQKDAEGREMVDLIKGGGMIPGIKVDKAYNKKGIWGTHVGPLGHPEVATVGLDDLQERCAKAYKQGARFAKWRNVLQLDPEKGLPSKLAIADTVHTLARYASICQMERLVPIVEPEIVPNGTHDIYYCAKMTERVLEAQYKALSQHRVYLPGTVLKPNMVKNGLKGPRASTEEVATLTVQTLLRTVPPEVPGIFFLSGETALDEDNEETATVNLSAMNKAFKGKMPWHLSFSYGKALQKTCIVTWCGKAENKEAAQKALKARANANADAVRGTYKAGTCPSVGTDGNVKQAAGPY